MSELTAYLSFLKFEDELVAELNHLNIPIYKVMGRLVLTKAKAADLVWAQDVWQDCEILEIESVGDAAKKMSSNGKRWCGYHEAHFRRAELIQEKVFRYKAKDLEFLQFQNKDHLELPNHQWCAWSLIEKDIILISKQTKSFLPLNEVEFKEDKVNPPSRAYLKLWETFTVHTAPPKKGQRVVDFGSCPGGWTWVLANLGCDVISIDKASIDERLLKRPEVKFLKKDAFSLKPADIGKIDWFLSDIICYPPDLYELVQEWIKSGLCSKFVCTIKFQGDTDYETCKKFLAIPNSKLVHLHSNKHEITWIKS